MPEIVERRHTDGATRSRALYSPCGAYRYGLERTWSAEGATLLWVMLNPSTATEIRNDPTIERCERRARAWGMGTMRIANLFAFRATAPADLKSASDPVGPLNDRILSEWHALSDMTIAAWGVHGAFLNRDRKALALLTGPLHTLGLTKAGLPRHPLYVGYATQPDLWKG